MRSKKEDKKNDGGSVSDEQDAKKKRRKKASNGVPSSIQERLEEVKTGSSSTMSQTKARISLG